MALGQMQYLSMDSPNHKRTSDRLMKYVIIGFFFILVFFLLEKIGNAGRHIDDDDDLVDLSKGRTLENGADGIDEAEETDFKDWYKQQGLDKNKGLEDLKFNVDQGVQREAPYDVKHEDEIMYYSESDSEEKPIETPESEEEEEVKNDYAPRVEEAQNDEPSKEIPVQADAEPDTVNEQNLGHDTILEDDFDILESEKKEEVENPDLDKYKYKVETSDKIDDSQQKSKLLDVLLSRRKDKDEEAISMVDKATLDDIVKAEVAEEDLQPKAPIKLEDLEHNENLDIEEDLNSEAEPIQESVNKDRIVEETEGSGARNDRVEEDTEGNHDRAEGGTEESGSSSARKETGDIEDIVVTETSILEPTEWEERREGSGGAELPPLSQDNNEKLYNEGSGATPKLDAEESGGEDLNKGDATGIETVVAKEPSLEPLKPEDDYYEEDEKVSQISHDKYISESDSRFESQEYDQPPNMWF